MNLDKRHCYLLLYLGPLDLLIYYNIFLKYHIQFITSIVLYILTFFTMHKMLYTRQCHEKALAEVDKIKNNIISNLAMLHLLGVRLFMTGGTFLLRNNLNSPRTDGALLSVHDIVTRYSFTEVEIQVRTCVGDIDYNLIKYLSRKLFRVYCRHGHANIINHLGVFFVFYYMHFGLR